MTNGPDAGPLVVAVDAAGMALVVTVPGCVPPVTVFGFADVGTEPKWR